MVWLKFRVFKPKANMFILDFSNFVKPKFLEILRMVYFYRFILIKYFLSTYECWGFWLIGKQSLADYLEEITNILNQVIS